MLFLTATNLTTRRLEIFDSTDPRYDDLPVAQAVRASAGFPFFFQPVDIDFPDGDCSYVDGGIVSNFPAHVFSDDFRKRLVNLPREYWPFMLRPWVHIGLRLVGGSRPRIARELLSSEAFFRAVYGMLTGEARNELEDRLASFVTRSVTISQPYTSTNGPENFLAVDHIKTETIRSMFERGRRFAAEQLQLSFALPKTTEVEPMLQALLRRVRLVFGQDLHFRSNVFLPQGEALVIRYQANMDNPKENPDQKLRFYYEHGLTGFCFVRRRPLICNLERFGKEFGAQSAEINPAELFGMTPDLQNQVRQDRTWLASMPIFDPYASYREMMSNPRAKLEGRHYAELSTPVDGAVFGVLNVDAAIQYGAIGLSDDPQEHQKDERILATLDIMRSVATAMGNVFSDAFARREQRSND